MAKTAKQVELPREVRYRLPRGTVAHQVDESGLCLVTLPDGGQDVTGIRENQGELLFACTIGPFALIIEAEK